MYCIYSAPPISIGHPKLLNYGNYCSIKFWQRSAYIHVCTCRMLDLCIDHRCQYKFKTMLYICTQTNSCTCTSVHTCNMYVYSDCIPPAFCSQQPPAENTSLHPNNYDGTILSLLPCLRLPLVAVDEGQQHGYESALRERTGEEVGTIQQTHTTVNKRSQLKYDMEYAIIMVGFCLFPPSLPPPSLISFF